MKAKLNVISEKKDISFLVEGLGCKLVTKNFLMEDDYERGSNKNAI